MHHKTLLAILFICIWLVPVHAADTTDTVKVGIISGSTALTTALSRADMALSQSLLNPNTIKGELGEAIASTFLEKTSKGMWTEISPRLGRQGLDHVYIKINNKGQPIGLMVGETKVNASQLGMTKDGLQMSKNWSNSRLIKVGNTYQALGNLKVKISKKPILPKQRIDVPLANGKTGMFWRENPQSPWKYSGPPKSLLEAQKQSRLFGTYLNAAGKGAITYRQRLFNVKLNGNNVSLTISNLDNTANTRGKPKTINLGDVSKYSNTKQMNKAVAKALKNKFPDLSDQECLAMAKKTDVLKVIKQQRYDLAIRTLQTSGLSSLFAMTLDTGFQLLFNKGQINNIEWGKVAFAGGAGFVAAGSGQLATMSLLSSSTGRTAIRSISSSLNISSGMARNLIGGATGGAVTAIVYGVGGYLLGYYTSQDAAVVTTVGIAQVMAVQAISANATSFVGTSTVVASYLGTTATTLTSIGNTTLTWFGASGALSAAAVSSAIITGGAMIAVFAVTSGVTKAIGVYYNHQNLEESMVFLEDFIKNNNGIQDHLIKKCFPQTVPI